jgi:DNA-binding NarL/FixJ family response regulator
MIEDFKPTPRQQDVIDCIKKGMSNKQIASFLSLSPYTVVEHAVNIMNALAFESRTQIAIWAVRLEIEKPLDT